VIARMPTIRAAIERSEEMVKTLESGAIFFKEGDDSSVTRDYMLDLERYVLETLKEVYYENIGRRR